MWMDDVGQSLKLSTVMQEQMQKGYEKLQNEACSFIAFSLKWKDLEEHFDLIRKSIEDQFAKLGAREKENCLKEQEWISVKKSLEECSEELKLKKEELIATQNSLQHCQEEVALKKQQLRETEELLGKSCLEIESEKKVLESIRNLIQEQDEELKKKGKEYDQLQKRTDECCSQLQSKEKYLIECSTQVSLEQKKLLILGENFKAKEEKLKSIQEQMRSANRDIELKERTYLAIKSKIEDCEKAQAAKSNQIQSMKLLVRGSNEELRLKEEQLVSVKASLESISEQLKSKEKDLDALNSREKEIELDIGDFVLKKQLMEMELETKQKQLEEEWTKLLDKEKALQLLQKPLENQILQQKDNIVLAEVKTEEIIDWDGKYLLGLYIDQLKKHDGLKTKIHAAFRMLQDPAALVLDAMQGFHFPHTGQNNAGSELDITRRSCMLLLDTLKNYSPSISPKVTEEALKLAREWKLEMSKQHGAGRDYSEVMGFLKLVETYELRSYFSSDELNFLLDVHAHHGHLSRLRKDLANKKVPGKTLQVSASPGQRTMQLPRDVHSHNSEKTLVESLAALRFSSDPAKLVLDTLTKRISEKLKKGDEVAAVLGSSLSLFEGLKDVKANISVGSKEQALKLAFEWKENLGISSDYHLEVFSYLKFLTVFELVSPHRDIPMELLKIPSPQRPALSSLSTAGFVDEVSDFIQMLIEKQQCIEAVRFACIFNLVGKFPPEQHLKDYLQKIKEKTHDICNGTDPVTLKGNAIDEELAALKATLNCISDFNLPFEHLRRNIKKHMSELKSQKKLGHLLRNIKESKSELKSDKKRRKQDSHKAGAPTKSLKVIMRGRPSVIRLD